MSEQCIITGKQGSFYWSTEYYHPDNSFTMDDFLSNHLSHAEIILIDGSYCEVSLNGNTYRIDAKGNGDSFHHVIVWNKLTE